MKTFVPTLLIVFLLTCFGFLPKSHAVSPPPDGGYAGGNTAEGQNALFSLTTGTYNTALGLYSLLSDSTGNFNTGVGAGTLLVNTADSNTATGAGALLNNTTGTENTANGTFALFFNTTGGANTAVGASALLHNTQGTFNNAIGDQALLNNTTGSENTANGSFALSASTDSSFNTAIGTFALANNSGDENTGVGVDVLFNNTAGGNTGIGARALRQNTTGFQNVAVGHGALTTNVEGSFNTALGKSTLALNTGDGNTACGNVALFDNVGNNNTALGNIAGSNLTTGDNNIDIGYNVGGVAGESNTIRIGNSDITATFITGISGATASGGAQVFVNSNGKLGTSTSSARFKEDIKPMGKASEAILALKPVSFRYKKEIDAQSIPQFGLVAEEVEKVNPDLIIRDREGKPQTVRYEQVNAMLLNEFLKEHRKNEEQEVTIARLQKQIEALTAGLQKVSAQLEVSKVPQQMVNNN